MISNQTVTLEGSAQAASQPVHGEAFNIDVDPNPSVERIEVVATWTPAHASEEILRIDAGLELPGGSFEGRSPLTALFELGGKKGVEQYWAHLRLGGEEIGASVSLDVLVQSTVVYVAESH